MAEGQQVWQLEWQTESSHLEPQAGSRECELEMAPPVNRCCYCVGLVETTIVLRFHGDGFPVI